MDKWGRRINFIATFALGLLVSPVLLYFNLFTGVFITMFIATGILSLYLFYVSTIKNN
jgi:hypothetical protein